MTRRPQTACARLGPIADRVVQAPRTPIAAPLPSRSPSSSTRPPSWPADPERRGDGATLSQGTDQPARLLAGPLSQRPAGADLPGRLRLGRDRTGRLGATETLEPHQRHRPARRGQIPHPYPTLAHAPFAERRRHGQQHEPGQPEHGRYSNTVLRHLGPLLRVQDTMDLEPPGPYFSPAVTTRRSSPTTLQDDEPDWRPDWWPRRGHHRARRRGRRR